MGISFHRGSAGEPGRELIFRELWKMNEGACRNRAFLTEEAQCGGPLGRATLRGTLEYMLRKAVDMGISFHMGPIGKPGGDSLAGAFEKKRIVHLGSFLGSMGH